MGNCENDSTIPDPKLHELMFLWNYRVDEAMGSGMAEISSEQSAHHRGIIK
jgi:hypothetical protein